MWLIGFTVLYSLLNLAISKWFYWKHASACLKHAMDA